MILSLKKFFIEGLENRSMEASVELFVLGMYKPAVIELYSLWKRLCKDSSYPDMPVLIFFVQLILLRILSRFYCCFTGGEPLLAQ